MREDLGSVRANLHWEVCLGFDLDSLSVTFFVVCYVNIPQSTACFCH